MKTLIFLSICVAYCTAVSLQDPQCAHGPSYWCSNVKTAKACGAVKHCILTVWTHDKPIRKNTQNDEICSYCQNLVTDVRNFMSKKETQEQIEKYLDEACSLIPETSLQSTCKEMVNSYLPEVFQIIESEMDPQAVCAALGLCTGFEYTPRMEESTSKTSVLSAMHSKAGDTYCADCKKFFSDIQAIVKSNQTQLQIEELIDNQFCPMLGELKDLCKEVMDAYIPQVLQMLGDQVDPSVICASLGMCQGDRSLLARMRLRMSPLYKGLRKGVASAETCLLCKTVVSELQSLDRNKQTQAMIENFVLQKICPSLGPLASECKVTVQDYGQDLFEVLANLLDPDNACQELGFCSATIPLLVGGSVRVVDGNQIAPKSAAKSDVQGSETCVLCEFVMKEVQGMLKHNATRDEIENALDKVCSYLPSTISTECQEFVNTYAKAIIALLVQEISPKEVCTTLGLCSQSKALKFRPRLQVKANSELCDTCKLVWQYVDSLLEENSTIQQIEQLLDKVCNYLPETYKDQCEDIIRQYGPAVIQLIAQYADPMEVCTDIGLCGNTSVTAKGKSEKIHPKLQQLLGEKKCTYGPSFWCASRENAKMCGTVPHCEKHVWKNN